MLLASVIFGQIRRLLSATLLKVLNKFLDPGEHAKVWYEHFLITYLRILTAVVICNVACIPVKRIQVLGMLHKTI